jgi:hypothetical protein
LMWGPLYRTVQAHGTDEWCEGIDKVRDFLHFGASAYKDRELRSQIIREGLTECRPWSGAAHWEWHF